MMGLAPATCRANPQSKVSARTPERALHVGVQQYGAIGEGVYLRYRFGPFNPQGPNHAQAPLDEPAAIGGRFIAMKLRRVQTDATRNFHHALWGFVYENAHPYPERRQRLGYLPRLLYFQTPGGTRNEIEPQGVGA